MKNAIAFILAMFGISAPHLFANESAANADVPMVGDQFDFRKMVMNLLGLSTEATTDMVNEAYKSAMAADFDDPALKGKIQLGEEAIKANAKLTEELAAANTKLEQLGQPQEIKIKILDKDVTLSLAANAQSQEITELAGLVRTHIEGLTTRATTAEQLAANERQARRKLLLNALLKEGRLTKAQLETEEKRLSGEAFANADKFDAEIAEMAKRPSSFGVATSLIGNLNLGQLTDDKANTLSAANEFRNLVAEEQKSKNVSYEVAWANCKKSDKGKALYAQMKQPESAVA